MVDLVDLTQWKKQKQIIEELYQNYGIIVSKDGRKWRNAVERWNKQFTDGDVGYFITHSNIKGFKATRDYEEAKIARNDYMKRAINMFKKAHDCDKAFGRLDNFKIDFENGEIK